MTNQIKNKQPKVLHLFRSLQQAALMRKNLVGDCMAIGESVVGRGWDIILVHIEDPTVSEREALIARWFPRLMNDEGTIVQKSPIKFPKFSPKALEGGTNDA